MSKCAGAEGGGSLSEHMRLGPAPAASPASFLHIVRYRNKLYVCIPGGEIQFGLLSHRLTVWFRGRRYFG